MLALCTFSLVSRVCECLSLFDCNAYDSLTKEASAQRLLDAFAGMLTAANIYVGDKFDLYKTLHQRGALSAAELSNITGFSERVLLEWLLQSAGAKFLEYESATKRFRLKASYAPFLLDPRVRPRLIEILYNLFLQESEDSIIGVFQIGPALVQRTAELHKSLETGKAT